MKKSRIAAPLPVKVVLQYRLIALVVLGVMVIGALYVPAISDDVRLSAKADSCTIENCYDLCLPGGAISECACNAERTSCSCEAEPSRQCSWGEQCYGDPSDGTAHCIPPDYPHKLVCCLHDGVPSAWLDRCPAGEGWYRPYDQAACFKRLNLQSGGSAGLAVD